MYGVSEAYKEAMKLPVQHHTLKGMIGEHSFTDKNILAGSFSITNQCCGNDSVEIGQVYIGELNATFLNVPLGRYQWKGQEIIPEFGLRLADGTYEYIPLGVYTIDTAEWTASGVVVKAYDHMALLDKTCNKVLTEVTPYTCMLRIADETGVVFANSEADFDSFANGKTMISETTTNDVETWRDLVSWLAQTIGCFATADREGKIVFRAYTEAVSDTIDSRHRFAGASFSDFVTRYTGLSVVNMEDSTTNYYGLDVDDGLTMNLGSNPFLQYGIDATKEQMRRAILDALQAINYVPFKAKALGNPAYDLGDVLVFRDGLADGSKKYCITKYVFNYHGEYEMTGVGQDPALASARSKTDKNIAGLLANTNENVVVHYQFSNSKKIEVADGGRETLATIRFATATKDSEVSLWAELLIDTEIASAYEVGNTQIEDVSISSPPINEELQKEMDAVETAVISLDERMTKAETALSKPDKLVAMVSYMLNGTEVNYHPVETYAVDGKHIMALHYYLGSVKANTMYTFVIMLEASGGTCAFDINCVNVFLSGMGLAATEKWDGTFTVEEKFEGISFGTILGRIQEKVDTRQIVPDPAIVFSDAFSFSFASILGGMEDSVSISKVVKYYILSDTEGSPELPDKYVKINSEDAFVLRTDYSVDAKQSEVDEGYLDVLDLYGEYDEILILEGMVVK